MVKSESNLTGEIVEVGIDLPPSLLKYAIRQCKVSVKSHAAKFEHGYNNVNLVTGKILRVISFLDKNGTKKSETMQFRLILTTVTKQCAVSI